MKFLVFSDSHITNKPFKYRKDNVFQSQMNKFKQIINIIKEEDIDYILSAGDLFDKPDPSFKVVAEFLNLFSQLQTTQFFAIAGNHDLYNQNLHTLDKTVLSVLDKSNFLNLLSQNSIFLEKNNVIVQLNGIHFQNNKNKFYHKFNNLSKDSDSNYMITLIHQAISHQNNKKVIPLNEISSQCKSDIVIIGHVHQRQGIFKRNGKYFIFPSALIRRHFDSRDRIPKVAIITLEHNKINVKLKELEVKSADEIFYTEEKLNNKRTKRNFVTSFKDLNKNKVEDLANQKVDLNKLLKEVANKKKIDSNVKKEINNLLKKSKKELNS